MENNHPMTMTDRINPRDGKLLEEFPELLLLLRPKKIDENAMTVSCSDSFFSFFSLLIHNKTVNSQKTSH
jgi:hypothetical protein